MNVRDFKNISRDSFMNGLPWIATFVGVFFIILGYTLFTEASPTQGIFRTIGQALLVGGVFAVILKSFQFMGIFQKEIYDLIWAEKFIGIRNDVEDLWCKITSSIYQGKFHDLSPHLQQAIIREYLPTDKIHYYRNYRRVAKIDWFNKEKRIIQTIEQLDIVIVPCDPAVTVPYSYSYEAKTAEGEKATSQEITDLTINGVDYRDALKTEEFTDSNGEHKVRYRYDIKLEGEKEYNVHRISKKCYSLEVDPYSRYTSETFIHGSSVKVSVVPTDLQVEFISLGTVKDYTDNGLVGTHADKGREIDKTFVGLLFPRQGYVLYFSRRET